MVLVVPFAVSRELQHAGIAERADARLVRRFSLAVGAAIGVQRCPSGPVSFGMAVMAAKPPGGSGAAVWRARLAVNPS